jgi:nitroreductase
MTNLGLSADEVLTTTRAVRKRIDFDRPVPRSIIEESVDIAQQAPSGSNRQDWAWIMIDDPDTKHSIAEMYRSNFLPYIESTEAPPEGSRQARIRDSAIYMAERLHEVPLMVIPCIRGRLDESASTVTQAARWGSLLPAVWSFCLALRERGLGSSWTTLHLPSERAAAEVIGLDFDSYTQAGLFPIGYTLGNDFKPAKRMPASETVHWNHW